MTVPLTVAVVGEWLRNMATTPLFRLGGEPITLLWVAQILTLLIAVSLVASGCKRLLKHSLLSRLGISEGNREVIATLLGLGVGAAGYVVVLQSLGLNLQSLAVMAGGVGLGAGIGLQELTKNLASGMTLLIERKLKAGDLVEFGGKQGYIEEISLRSTVVRTFRGSQIIVPNTELADAQVENWNYKDYYGRIEIPVLVARSSDPLLVTEVLLECAAAEPQVVAKPPPKVVFKGMGENSLEFELWAWVAQIDRGLMVKSSLNYAIDYYLRRRQIRDPIPQREVLVRSSSLDAAGEPLGALISAQAKALARVGPGANDPTDDPANDQVNNPLSCLPLKDLLRQIRYFAHFNDLQLRALIELGYRRVLQPQELLFRQGEQAESFCLVLSGAIAAIYDTQRISRRLFVFEAGQYFGELPLMLKLPYPTSMIATLDTTLFVINRENFEPFLARYPALAEDIARAVSDRQDVLETYRQHLEDSGLMDSETQKDPVAWLRDRLKQFFRCP